MKKLYVDNYIPLNIIIQIIEDIDINQNNKSIINISQINLSNIDDTYNFILNYNKKYKINQDLSKKEYKNYLLIPLIFVYGYYEKDKDNNILKCYYIFKNNLMKSINKYVCSNYIYNR